MNIMCSTHTQSATFQIASFCVSSQCPPPAIPSASLCNRLTYLKHNKTKRNKKRTPNTLKLNPSSSIALAFDDAQRSVLSAPSMKLKLLCFMSFDQLVRLWPFRTSDFLQFHSHSSRHLLDRCRKQYVIHFDRIGRNLLFSLFSFSFISFTLLFSHCFDFDVLSQQIMTIDIRMGMNTEQPCALATTTAISGTGKGKARATEGKIPSIVSQRAGAANTPECVAHSKNRRRNAMVSPMEDVRHKAEGNENDWPVRTLCAHSNVIYDTVEIVINIQPCSAKKSFVLGHTPPLP